MAADTQLETQSSSGAEDLNRLPAELVFRSIRSRNLFEETVFRLRQAIKLGVVPRGERFPTERELAERLEVSRVTVREALRALEQAGFIETRRGRHGGAFVLGERAKQSKQQARKQLREMKAELEDVLDFRRAVEPVVAELAADRYEESDIEAAAELLTESERVPPSGFRGADSRFHLALASMASSPSMAAATADIQLRISELAAAVPLIEETVKHSHRQHRGILEAIRARDRERARAAMLEHIDATAVMLHSFT